MKLTSLCITFLLIVTNAHAEIRTWTAKNGKTFVGELVSIGMDRVKLKGENGKTISVPIAGLCKKDQDYVGLKRPIGIDISLETTRSPNNDSFKNPRIILKYRESGAPHTKLDLYTFAFDEKDQFINHERKTDIQFSRGNKKTVLITESINLHNKRMGNVLALIVDSAGRIIAHKGTDPRVDDNIFQNRILNQIRCCYLSQVAENEQEIDDTAVLTGRIYNLHRMPDGQHRSQDLNDDGNYSQKELDAYWEEIRGQTSAFARNGFHPEELSKYGCSTNSINTPCLFIPTIRCTQAAQLLNMNETKVDYPIVNNSTEHLLFHLKGKIKHHADITFRLVGKSSSIMHVGMDGTCILSRDSRSKRPDLVLSAIPSGDKATVRSKWISLKEGESVDLDVVFAPFGRGIEYSMNGTIFVEVKGAAYPVDDQGQSILPLLTTQPLTEEFLNSVYEGIQPGIQPPEPVVFKVIPNK